MEACLEVQRDPYAHLLSEWDQMTAKQYPARLFLIGAFAGAYSLYYLSRNAELNRIRQLKISMNMLVNVSARVALAGFVGDLVGRKLFINY